MVTWGANTVHTFGGATPAPAGASAGFSFGSPSSSSSTVPAPSTGLFGSAQPSSSPSSSGSLFGSSSSPAPSSTGYFGSAAPAPSTPSGGLFGSAPAPGSGLFGSASGTTSLFGSASSPGGGLFGGSSSSSTASGGLFGATPAPSPFGFGQQQQQQQPPAPQIPAQAALQAHLDAEARQEEARIGQALQSLHNVYTGRSTALENNNQSAPFSCVLYNPVTLQVRQQQWLQSSVPHGEQSYSQIHPIVPPRPWQISESDWNQAVVRNQDLNYMPAAMIGATALQARLTYQQEMADRCVQQLKTIQQVEQLVRERARNVQQELQYAIHSKHESQRKRLLQVMKKIEILRCFNLPLQRDEVLAMQQLMDLYRQAAQLRATSAALAETAQTSARNQVNAWARLLQQQQAMVTTTAPPEEEEEDKLLHTTKQVLPILKEHRDTLTKLTEQVKKDRKDLELIHNRLAETLTIGDVPPPPLAQRRP